MIQIEIPDIEVDCIARWMDMGVPYNRKSSLPLTTYNTESRYPDDFLSQGGELFKEKDVDNGQAFVTFQYHPFYHGLVSSPTSEYPDRLVTDDNQELLRGMIHAIEPYHYNDYWGSHTVCVILDQGNWEFIDLTFFDRFPTLLRNVYREQLHSVQYALDRATMNRVRHSWMQGVGPIELSMSVRDLTPEQMLMVSDLYGAPWSAWDDVLSWFNYSLKSPPPFISPTQLLDWTYTRLRPLVVYEPFPIEFSDDGLLAMQACEKFNSNHVNMIEFFHDLHDPADLIPKLRNLQFLKGLRGLKNMSDEYLRVHYGIMPTISDLRSIVAAFQRVAPFIDANGYKIETSSHYDSVTVGELTFRLEQHVKVASQTEDFDFLQLAAALDSLGMLPNLENIWDLVPFSFVIDWFVNVGSLLERLDARMRVAYLEVKYATLSHKTVIFQSFDASEDMPYDITLQWVRYHRWTTDHCPVPNLTLPSVGNFNHWLESGALIIQRLLKGRK